MKQKYVDKYSEEEIIEACVVLAERINKERVSGKYLNIQHENIIKTWSNFKRIQADKHMWWKEYKRLLKKALRYKIDTKDIWK